MPVETQEAGPRQTGRKESSLRARIAERFRGRSQTQEVQIPGIPSVRLELSGVRPIQGENPHSTGRLRLTTGTEKTTNPHLLDALGDLGLEVYVIKKEVIDAASGEQNGAYRGILIEADDQRRGSDLLEGRHVDVSSGDSIVFMGQGRVLGEYNLNGGQVLEHASPSRRVDWAHWESEFDSRADDEAKKQSERTVPIDLSIYGDNPPPLELRAVKLGADGAVTQDIEPDPEWNALLIGNPEANSSKDASLYPQDTKMIVFRGNDQEWYLQLEGGEITGYQRNGNHYKTGNKGLNEAGESVSVIPLKEGPVRLQINPLTSQARDALTVEVRHEEAIKKGEPGRPILTVIGPDLGSEKGQFQAGIEHDEFVIKRIKESEDQRKAAEAARQKELEDAAARNRIADIDAHHTNVLLDFNPFAPPKNRN